MTQITCVDQKLRCSRKVINPLHCFLQRCRHVLVGVFVKPDVTIADLYKAESAAHCHRAVYFLSEQLRTQNAALHGPKHTSSCPRHTFQKSTTIDTVFIRVYLDIFRHFALLSAHADYPYALAFIPKTSLGINVALSK